MFLTDGLPTDSITLIMQNIKTKNAELNNEVVILTYGMLMKEKDLQILKDIAKQEGQGVTRAPNVTVSILRLSFPPGMRHFLVGFLLAVPVSELVNPNCLDSHAAISCKLKLLRHFEEKHIPSPTK